MSKISVNDAENAIFDPCCYEINVHVIMLPANLNPYACHAVQPWPKVLKAKCQFRTTRPLLFLHVHARFRRIYEPKAQ